MGPLSQFQHAQAEKEDTRKLVFSISSQIENDRLPDERLAQTFEQWWPNLEHQLKQIPQPAQRPPERGEREMIEEILELVRAIPRPSIPPISFNEEIASISRELNGLGPLTEFLKSGKLDMAATPLLEEWSADIKRRLIALNNAPTSSQ